MPSPSAFLSQSEEAARHAAARQKPSGLSRLCLGFEPSPELAAIASGYYAQGAKDQLAILAMQYLLKDSLHFQPNKVELWHQIARTPWVIKPVLGFISDTFPIGGERRRPYLIAAGLTGTLAFLALGLVNSAWTALLGMFLVESSIAFVDVVVDGIVVECARLESPERAGSLQSICWGSEAVGILSSAAAAGWLLSHLGPQKVLAAMAVLPLSVVLASMGVREQHIPYPASDDTGTGSWPLQEGELEHEQLVKPDQPASTLEVEAGDAASHPAAPERRPAMSLAAEHIRLIFAALTRRHMFIPAVYILLNQGPYAADNAMFFFYTSQLKLTPEFIGIKQFVDGIAILCGVLLYNWLLRNIAMRRVLLWVTVACALASLTQLMLVTGANHAIGISDKVFVLVDSFIVKGAMRVGFMPIFVLAAQLCPKGIEAAVYATLMSIQNLGGGAAGLAAAGLMTAFGITATDFSLLWLLLLLLIVPNLLSLLTLPYMPRQALDAAQSEAAQDSQEH